MSDIVVLGFTDEAAADAFNERLGKMQDEGVLELDDGVKVTVGQDGKVKLHHGFSLVRGGAVFGGFMGAIVGTLFLAPLAGAALGAAGGAAVGELAGDYGIDDDFIKRTSETLKPGTAALFLMVDKGVSAEADEELRGAEATIITTTLPEESKARLQAALSAGAEGKQS